MLSTVPNLKSSLQELKVVMEPRFTVISIPEKKKKVFLLLTASHISLMIKMIV